MDHQGLRQVTAGRRWGGGRVWLSLGVIVGLLGGGWVRPAIAQSPRDRLTAPLPSTPDAPLRQLPGRQPERPAGQPPESLINTGLSSYVIGPGDQIGVTVVGFDELERVRIVLPDGTILLPLIGPVVAAGKTLESLETEITRRFSFYLVDPVIEINLARLRPVVVTVGGEVNRPGPVQLDSLSAFDTPVLEAGTIAPTLNAALVRAGGVRRTADLRNVTVQRRLPGGEQTTLTINLWDALFQGGENNNILLQDGDIVFVPAAPADAPLSSQLVARSSLAPEVIQVRVTGEVRRPGQIDISPDSSVSAAIAAVGGHTPESANLSEVLLLRLADNGQVEEQTLDLRNLADTTPIQDGDVIVVPRRGYLSVLDSIGRTVQPIAAPFNLLLLFERLFFSD